MNNVKKVAAAVAMAIGAAGTGVVQSDIVDFGYGASSPTVHTVLSVVNTLDRPTPEQEELHFRYFYKSGDIATDNSALCEEVDFTWSTSPNDLVTVSPDGHFGENGVMFNDPTPYAPIPPSLALLQGIIQPIRFKTFIDNNGRDENILDGGDNTLTAARAVIVETQAGAAWGYAGYNPSGNSWINGSNDDGLTTGGGFAETNEVFGEVIGPNNSQDGVDVAIAPFDDFLTVFFVQPIAIWGMHNDEPAVQRFGGDQRWQNLEAQVTISVSDYTRRPQDAMFDRDENPVSAPTPQRVTCVGAVAIRDLLSQGAELLLQDSGGWGEFKTIPLVFNGVVQSASEGRLLTPEIVAEFLEYNDINGDGIGNDIDGLPAGGVVNNGYALRED